MTSSPSKMNQKKERRRENNNGRDNKRFGPLFASALSGIVGQGDRSNTDLRSKCLTERLPASSTNHGWKGNTDEQHSPDKKNEVKILKNIPKPSKNECNVQDQNEFASNSPRNRSLSDESVKVKQSRNIPEAKHSDVQLNHKKSGANECVSNRCRKPSTPKGDWKYDVYQNETASTRDHRVKRSKSFRDAPLSDRSPAFPKKDNWGRICRQSISSQSFQETNEKSYCHKRYESQKDYGQHALYPDYRSENDEEEFDGCKGSSERCVSDCEGNLRVSILNPLQRKNAESFNPKSELNSQFNDRTSKKAVIVPTPENNTNNHSVLYNNRNACSSDTGDEEAFGMADKNNSKRNTSAVHSKISHLKSDESNEKVYDFPSKFNFTSECQTIEGISTIRNESDQNLCHQCDSVLDFRAIGDKKMHSCEEIEVCPTGEAELCPKILPEQYEAVTNYILEIEKERKVDCQIAQRVIYDLTRFFGYYFPGTIIDYYGSYRSGLAITTSNINISLKSDAPLRNSFWPEVHKGFSKELSANPKYHVLPYEDKASVKATKIVFIEPYTSVECEMAYLGKAEKNVCRMADLLRTVSMFDVRVKSLFIAARIWAEVCAIDEVEDGKLPAVAFPLLVTYFLQRCQEPVLPVLKMEELKVMQQKLKACPKTAASVGELWFEFLRFYAVIFNWDENIVSITNLEPVSKSSKCMEKVWIYIEDPFSGENIAKSVTNLDTANFIRACFDAFYCHRPSLYKSSSDSVKGSKRWIYSFDTCDVYQYAPPECEDCAAFGIGVCEACAKKEYVPVATPLPDLPDDSLLLKTADKVLHDVYNEYILSESAIKGRKAFVEDLEKYIQQRFKGAKLALFGSSVNGFGFNKSDLDINLTFSTNEGKKWSEQSLILKQVMRHLRKNENYKDVFFLPAQIPIVKFCYVQNGWCGDISFGNSLAVNNSELLHAYSTVDERCRILGCALKLVAKKTELASTTDKALSSYSYIIMVIYYLQQVKPPVLPVLQDYKLRANSLEVPIEIVETWNTWFFRGDKKTYADILSEQSGQPKNTKTAAQLWIGLLDFYVNFNYDRVISIRQREILPVEEKQRTFHSFNIEDPFILSKNLGSVLSSGKHKELQVVLGNARQLFGNEKKFPKNIDNYKNYFFSPSFLTGRAQKEKECSICGDFNHETNQCQRLQKRKFQFRKYQTFNKYTNFFKF